jgi:hypothetical protein
VETGRSPFVAFDGNNYHSPYTKAMETMLRDGDSTSMTPANRVQMSAPATDRGPGKAFHVSVLCATAIVAALSFSLEVRPGERIAFSVLPEHLLPHTCYSRVLFGVRCPGCGLTRSFVHLAHGQWRAAWQVHRLGWLLAAIVAIQFPYRAALVLGCERCVLGPRFAIWIGIAVIALLVANWCWQLWAGGISSNFS